MLWPLILIGLAAPTAAGQNAPFDQEIKTLLLRELHDHAGLARLAISEAELAEKKGQVELSFTLRQLQTPHQDLAVPLLIVTPERSFTATLTSREAATPVSLLLPERPTEIRLDPYQEVSRRLDRREIPPTWAGFVAADHRLAILPDAAPAAWAPLLDFLHELGIETTTLAEVRDRQLAAASLLFLSSPAQNPARGFFAESAQPADTMSLTVRDNPLNPEHWAVQLVMGSTAAPDLAALLNQLNSPGLFSQVLIRDGAIQQQSLAPATKGLRVGLDQPPAGIAVADRRDFQQIMTQLADTRVVYVGEVHNRYEDHLLQLRVLRAMHRQNPRLALGMEMFPASAQAALDAYVAGEIDEPRFLKESNYFANWSFDYRLYREIIDFARHHRLPIVALNLERGITSKVFREGGISALSAEEQRQIPADRDLALPHYHQRLQGAFRMHDSDSLGEEADNFSGFLQAQSLWDEQMATRIAEFLRSNPGHRLLAVVGQGHSDKRNAIPPRLARRLPVSQAVILPLREQPVQGAADYLMFLAPQNLPEPALLGVRVQDGAEDLPGALVVGLNPHGKAQAAGILVNDLIVGLDNQQIADATDLRIALLYKEPGQTVLVEVQRPPAEAEEPAEHDRQEGESLTIAVEL
ncbi:ChaN family lipoprotein [Desulfurivibrio sp. C05AmB]|uniref:ChaN family lipoprotein n=1 Tax=Desulfurivibrio sp. C05AmB TaxID=3374371 RepID=UPI00376F174A